MKKLFYFFICLLFLSCSTPKQDDESLAQADSTITKNATTIQIAVASKKVFAAQIISNGKVLSDQEIPLSFRGQGIIDRIEVKNGIKVKAGQLLATLRNEEQQLALREARLLLDESRVEISDLLITQGGKRGDTSSVSSDVYAYIKLRSGYNRALLAVQKAELELSKTFLYAPVNGTVANLTLSPYSPTSLEKPFCILLNRNEMLIRCPILETELATVEIGQTAKIEAIGRMGIIYQAKVMDINPIVNAQGLVDVTIRVLRPDMQLLSGMNVRVIIERYFMNQLAIPKSAVVERSGRKVVFTYKDGLAKWHYVVTGKENDKEIIITEGLEAGEEVIISGNLNLGHDATVKKKNLEEEM